MAYKKYLQSALIGSFATVYGSAHLVPGAGANGPILSSAISLVSGKSTTSDTAETDAPTPRPSRVATALDAFQGVVRPLSRPRALEDAFRSYFAYKTANPGKVTKPYLYFVDYGQPSTAKRGYVFDMESLKIVDGPFTVAHGRGSAARNGIPTRFSNQPNSYATSLGLYLAQETYTFSGKAGGRRYSSVGLRLDGVSEGYNDNARVRKVVAHGAPYVTPKSAGRSEGCPAVEQSRAKVLLPKLANGGMVFLFAPDEKWMAADP